MIMQVMWSTFVPFIPNSLLPGIISGSLAATAVVMVRDTLTLRIVLIKAFFNEILFKVSCVFALLPSPCLEKEK